MKSQLTVMDRHSTSVERRRDRVRRKRGGVRKLIPFDQVAWWGKEEKKNEREMKTRRNKKDGKSEKEQKIGKPEEKQKREIQNIERKKKK